MKSIAIAVASAVTLLGVFLSIAASNSESSSVEKLAGRYALLYSTDAHYGVVRNVRIEWLADRAFIVFSPVGEEGQTKEDCWLPLKSIKRLRVFDSRDEALAAQQAKPANAKPIGQIEASAKGVVTMRGKPLANATLRLHADNGLAFPAALQNDGTYLIEHLSPGTYVVTVEGNNVKSKFRSANESPLRVKIEAGTNAVDFSLE